MPSLTRISPFSILILIIFTSFSGLGQTRPDILWMRGGHSRDVSSMDYSPDGQLFASVGDDRVFKIWRL
jgi:WD40 repeat protein